MCALWYYRSGEIVLGPVSSKELRRRAEQNQVEPDTLVKKAPAGRWVPAGEVKGLFAPAAGVPRPVAERLEPGPAPEVPAIPEPTPPRGPPALPEDLSPPPRPSTRRFPKAVLLVACGGVVLALVVSVCVVLPRRNRGDQELPSLAAESPPPAESSPAGSDQPPKERDGGGAVETKPPVVSSPADAPKPREVKPPIAKAKPTVGQEKTLHGGAAKKPTLPQVPGDPQVPIAGPKKEPQAAGPQSQVDGRLARLKELDEQLRYAWKEYRAADEEYKNVHDELTQVQAQVVALNQKLLMNRAEAEAVMKDKRDITRGFGGTQTPLHDRKLFACNVTEAAWGKELQALQKKWSPLADRKRALEGQSEGHLKAFGEPLPTLVWLCDPLGRLGAEAHQRALATLSPWLERNPASPILWMARGFANSNAGNQRQAIDDFHKAEQLDKRLSATLAVGRGLARARAGERRKWGEEFKAAEVNAAAKAPFVPGLLDLCRGHALLALERHPEAEKSLRAAVKFHPKLPQAHDALARFLVLRNRGAGAAPLAVKSATIACQLTEWQDWTYLEGLAAACRASGDPKTAAGWIKKAIELAPPDYHPMLTKRLKQVQSDRAPGPE